MGLEGLDITRHAWRRFIERRQKKLVRCPKQELTFMLERAKPEDLREGRVLRIISNGYDSADYYTYEDWRFVVDTMHQRLITVERIHVQPRPIKRAKKRRRQH